MASRGGVVTGFDTGSPAWCYARYPMPPTDFPAGYKPRHLLGEGSMGSVWLAYSAQARGHCAVKVLHLRDDRKGSAERSFNREVRAMARLSHPAVIEILDYGRTPQG